MTRMTSSDPPFMNLFKMHALSRRPSALRSRSLRLVAASLHHVALSIFMDRIEQAKVMLMQLVRSGLATLAELEQVPLEDLLGRRLVDRVVDANGCPDREARRFILPLSSESAPERENSCSLLPSCGMCEAV